jgi:hypothetical protein
MPVPRELDEVSITITGPAGEPVEARQALDRDHPLPLTLGVTPAGDALGPIDIVAEGRVDGAVVITRTARTTLLSGRSLMLYLFLSTDCAGVTCEDDGETCTENGCASIEIDAEELPPWTGTIPSRDAGVDASDVYDAGPRDGGGSDGGPQPIVCTMSSECDDGNACTQDVCMDEACTHLPDDTVCTAAPEGRCDLEFGCQYPSCSPATCVAGPCQTAMCNGSICERRSTCADGQTCCAGACVAA